MADFLYEDLLPIGDDTTEYRLLTTEGVSTVEGPDGRTFLQVEPEAMRLPDRNGAARHLSLPAHGSPDATREQSSTIPKRRTTTSSSRSIC